MNKKEKPKFPPRICANCFFLVSRDEVRICKKGLIFPTRKQTCKKYDGWL